LETCIEKEEVAIKIMKLQEGTTWKP
jgi:hypothetical protein